MSSAVLASLKLQQSLFSGGLPQVEPVMDGGTYFVENVIEQPCSPLSFPLKTTIRASAAFL